MHSVNLAPYLKGLEKVVKVLLIEGIKIAAFSIQ
jgi:hypothetical protein